MIDLESAITRYTHDARYDGHHDTATATGRYEDAEEDRSEKEVEVFKGAN